MKIPNSTLSVSKINETFNIQSGNYSIIVNTDLTRNRLEILTGEGDEVFMFKGSTAKTVKAIGHLLVAASCLIDDKKESEGI